MQPILHPPYSPISKPRIQLHSRLFPFFFGILSLFPLHFSHTSFVKQPEVSTPRASIHSPSPQEDTVIPCLLPSWTKKEASSSISLFKGGFISSLSIFS